MAKPSKQGSTSPGTGKRGQLLPGLFDIVTQTDELWDVIFKRLDRCGKGYGFSRVEVPFLEDPALYASAVTVGNNSGALLTAQWGGRTVAVRPNLLSSVLRAYHAAKLGELYPLSKWQYSGLALTAGPKQLVSDYQFGFEVFGNFTHLSVAQVLGAVWDVISSLGLDVVMEVNSSGTADTQQAYGSTLADFLRPKKYDLCDACVDRLHTQVLACLRCDELDCQALLADAPTILDFLSADDRKDLTNILEALEELNIPYQLNPLFVGSAGTTGICAVLKHKTKQENAVLGEAGYHAGLAAVLCGRPFPAFGFTGSLKLIHDLMVARGLTVAREQKSEVFLVPLGELAAKKSLRLFRDLLSAKIIVYDHFGNVGVKSQLKAAADSKSPIALIMGQKEAVDEMVILRDVKSGMQEMFRYDQIVEEVKKRLGK